MSLQRRLLWLLIAFVAFCLATTFGTIYAVRLHVSHAMADLQQIQNEALWLEQLRLVARERSLELREAVVGRGGAQHEPGRFDAFFEQLHQVARYTLRQESGRIAEDTLALAAKLRTAFDTCLAHIAADNHAAARAVLQEIDTELVPRLDSRLQAALGALHNSRSGAVDMVVVANTQVLALTLIIAILGVGCVVAATLLMRRWILVPVRRLEAATRALGSGELSHRVSPVGRDELGRLGSALNDMADKLTSAQADLSASEEKYRALFENLRDATLICNAEGRIVECQDGETALLGRLGRSCVGHSLLEVCPVAGAVDWSTIFGRVMTSNDRVTITDLRFNPDGDATRAAIVDVAAFPVRWHATTYVALVLRDVTEQRHSQEQLRRAEAMEATVTLARGVAHDFSGLLTGAIGSLSILSSELDNGRPSELVRRALRACGQAVGLSRTLLTFAGGDRGTPEVLPLEETIDLIISSLDERQLQGIELRLELQPVMAFIDRDQFTEIVLNLIRNACEAMPDGGELLLRLEPSKLPGAPRAEGPATHALLTVADTGAGIRDDVRDRLFEPFFTTKSRGAQRSRGMGLAVVYAAVKNAGGLVDVQSTINHGATFRVWLPFPESAEVLEDSRHY